MKFKRLTAALAALMMTATLVISANAATVNESSTDMNNYLVEESADSIQSVSLPLSEYPDRSYYSVTGKKCTCHGPGYNPCYWDNSCDCINFDNSIQCVAFAKYAYYRSHGYRYNSNSKIVVDKDLSGSLAKSYLKDKPQGTYVYGKSGSSPHAVVIVATTSTSITFYHANGYSKEPCKVRCETRTWDYFASYFTHLTHYAV